MSESLACATGCGLPGRHVYSKATQHPGDCPGCLPRPAAPALIVCWRCNNRTEDALTRAPDLVADIREHVMPGAGSPSDGLPGGKRVHAPAPLSVGAVADADDLHALLASWAQAMVDEAPDGLVGPDWGGTYRPTDGSGRRSVGLTTAGTWRTTARLVTWLHARQPWALAQPWAPDYVREVTSTVGRLRARWATTERPRYLPAPCPGCRAPSLVRYAPATWYGPVTITCQTCEIVVPEREFAAFAYALAAERRATRRRVAPS